MLMASTKVYVIDYKHSSSVFKGLVHPKNVFIFWINDHFHFWVNYPFKGL